MPNEESMAGLALAFNAGGALKAAKTTVLMTGAQGPPLYPLLRKARRRGTTRSVVEGDRALFSLTAAARRSYALLSQSAGRPPLCLKRRKVRAPYGRGAG